jgi:polysaccharide biosynthesis protein PslG
MIRHARRRMTPLLLLCSLLSLFADHTHAAPSMRPRTAPDESPFGMNTHLATRFPLLGDLARPASSVHHLGVAWAREDFAWPRIEPRRGAWQWEFTDQMMAQYDTLGIQVLGRLGYAVGWATADPHDPADGQTFAMPDIEAWREYISQTARRYKGRVRAWEIWNEPDNPIYWSGRPDPQAYARLLRVAHDAIKSADPSALVVLGGVSPFETSFLEGIARAGAWNAFDVLAIHPYTDPHSPEQGQIGPSGVGGVRALLNRHGRKPIWATEFGWESGVSERNPTGSVDEERQANYLVRGYMSLLAEPDLEKAFWYTLHDDTESPFGVVRYGAGYADYSSRKPSFAAFSTMTRELAGATFAKKVDLSTERRIVESWDTGSRWVQAGPDNGTLTGSGDRARSGGRSGRYDYRFPTGGNDWVAFRPSAAIDLGAASAIGLWVSGDNSGHLIQIQVEDQSGELLQFPLGKIGGAEWTWMQVSLTGTVDPGNRLGGGNNNGRLDGNARVRALVLDDQPNEWSGSGTIWVDDLTALSGPDAHLYRWQVGSESIDVVFAPGGANIRIPTSSPSATVIDRDGGSTAVAANGGAIALWVDDRPRYVRHTPAAEAPPRQQEQHVPNRFVTAPSDPAFGGVWSRTDATVAAGTTGRSWTWGPATFATGIEEYAESPEGRRLVQYWDKSRMEITNPGGNRSDLWFVTNGLLTKELISGRMQTAHSRFVDREPAEVPIAGDPVDANAPTYASFNSLASLNGDRRAPAEVGKVVIDRIDRQGRVTPDERMRGYNVRVAAHDPNLGHNMPGVFTDYFRSMPLDWVFVLGYPITEPYWTTVKVGGVSRDVLIQIFERRALTYTPSNAPAFRVEMGNVGQHYFRWRYGSSPWER